MSTVQIVIEESLLEAADLAARSQKINRSSFFRTAVREHLERLAVREKERRDRAGYGRLPDKPGDGAVWEKAAAWPDD
jgi:metal-responsive CopG/Arc/MetJ family transcriptional regulator